MGLLVGDVDAHPPRSREVLELLGGLQDVLLALLAESRQIAQFAFAREFRNSVNGGDLEIAPEKRDLLRAERLQVEQVQNRRRIFLQQFLAQAVVAGFEDFADVLGHPVADAGQCLELLVVRGKFFDALRNIFQKLRYFLVAAVAPDDRAINFEQLRGLTQDLCDVSIFHLSFLG